jgi:hypothetical protein
VVVSAAQCAFPVTFNRLWLGGCVDTIAIGAVVRISCRDTDAVVISVNMMTSMKPATRCENFTARMAVCGSPLQLRIASIATALALVAVTPGIALADEGGVSFWLPGFFGSLAAVPSQAPGWSVTSIYWHDSVSAGGDVARAREVELGRIPANLTANLSANLNSNLDLGFLIGTYTFATPVLGGQASASLMGIYGSNSTSLAGLLTGTLTTPGGATPFSRFDSIDSSLTAFGDLYPTFQLKWNAGVNNFMTYVTGDIPVGAYQSTRLANIGIGHWAADTGFGYT